jgi:membrane associated rhomboid family serine protease
MSGGRRGPASDLQVVASWLAVLWLIFAIDVLLRTTANYWLPERLGLRPHELTGLPGVLFAHFLHVNLYHIASNSLALLVLGWAACGYSRRLTGLALVYAGLIAGIFTWCFGAVTVPPTVHVGASGLIFGLIGFLLANGILRRGCLPLFLALLVLVLFSGALPGMLPAASARSPISWQMHLGGFVGGIIASWQLRRQRAT